MKATEKLLMCVLGALLGVPSAEAAVTCVANKSTGKFEEKANPRTHKVTGECDAQVSIAMVSSLDELEAVAKAEGTRVIGGVIVTNAAQPFEVTPVKKNPPQSVDVVPVSMSAEQSFAASKGNGDVAAVGDASSEKRDVPATPPVAPVKPLPSWTLTAGHTIGKDLQEWGKQAGWRVIWNLPKDWAVPAPTVFQGDFKTAASSVIKNLAANGAMIRAQFFDGNNTLVVSGPGLASQ